MHAKYTYEQKQTVTILNMIEPRIVTAINYPVYANNRT
jgi:hypothetical protein